MSVASAKLRALPTVATVGAAGVRGKVRKSDATFVGPHFATVEALLGAVEIADAVILQTRDTSLRDQWLAQLRRDARYALTPLLVAASAPLPPESLADGDYLVPEEAYRTIAEIRDRTLSLPNESLTDSEARLIGYLFTRPNKMLVPLPDWRSEHLHRYPLLEAFDNGGLDSFEWLQTLLRRRLIEPVQLIDRIRACPNCRGAHLSYIDLCASCGHLDIAETIFLHCYTCGHVEPQDDFLDAEGLGCPKCHARLRHIGVDYDRALETYSCHACSARFADPDIKARCLHCHTRHATTDLLEQAVHTYKLSAAGNLAARTGNVGDLFSLIDDANGAHPAYFERTLDWLLAVSTRHSEVQFGVLCIQLGNLRELIDSTSRGRAAQIMDHFARRLRELVRATDILMRSDERHCWLLLPQTPPAGLAVLKSRVEALPEAITEDGAMRLDVKVAAVASQELGDRRVAAKVLMSEMQGSLG
jgi:GGDEF domain-containing protein